MPLFRRSKSYCDRLATIRIQARVLLLNVESSGIKAPSRTSIRSGSSALDMTFLLNLFQLFPATIQVYYSFPGSP